MKGFANIVLAALSLIPILVSAQTGPGPCHPYPGAAAGDCLELIGNSLNDETNVPCDSTGRATISLRNCVITTACASGVTSVVTDTIARYALTTIGTCALKDYGSISGYYISADGSKTCYLYPGKCV